MKHATGNSVQQLEYEQHRISLEQERKYLQNAIGLAEDQLRSSEATTNGILGTGRASSDRELLIERSSHHRQRLKVVLEGLCRIRTGSFGLCIGCDKPIESKRLQAIPSAQYCIACQEQVEQAHRDHSLFFNSGRSSVLLAGGQGTRHPLQRDLKKGCGVFRPS
jgi:DnaK suppressor protein